MELNPQQKEIVDFPLSASALVMAGAGSGKTTVIAHRALSIIDKIPSDQYLQMLTFSNKAAKEMQERVKRVGIKNTERIKFDTFHSFGMRLIKDDADGYELISEFSLLNEADIKRSVRANAKALGLPKDLSPDDKKRLDPLAWLNTWSLARQAGYDVGNPANKSALCERLKRAHALSTEEVDLVWQTLIGYEREKRHAHAVDFDDLLYLPLLRIARDEIYRTKIQQQIGYVVVDEAQDTNRIQYELIRRIALSHCGVTCVGDDDQSIYGWRGAEVTNLRRFLANFQAAELRLEQNYRSTQAIVNTASTLIQHNSNRLEKRPFSEGVRGEIPKLRTYDDHRMMADAIAENIAKSIEAGISAREIAVLYRTNRMALLLEQSLRRWKIPYHVVGGMSLFDRGEVVAVTAALRLASNPRDTHALKSLTSYIDGFGPASSYIVSNWLEENPDRSMRDLPSSLPGISDSRLASLCEFYSDLMFEAVAAKEPNEFIQWAISGPMAILEREKDEQLRERKAQHLRSLGKDIADELSERIVIDPRLSWRDVMMEVALREVRQVEADGGQVTLSTIHRAKGLEWKEVFIAGMSNGLMPLDSKTEINEGEVGYSHIEEERRLAYVGITRAKERCHLFHASRYYFPGGREDKTYEPSRFIDEMGIEVQLAINSTLNCDDMEDGNNFDIQRFRRDFSGLFPRRM